MTISEKILFILHHPEKAKFTAPDNQVNLCLIGALFMDMMESKDIHLEDGKIVCNSILPQNSSYPTLFKILKKAKKPQSIKKWIGRLGFKAPKLKKEVLKKMASDKLVVLEHKKFLGLIPYTNSTLLKKSEHLSEVRTLKNAILLNNELSEQDAMVLSILIGSQLARILGKDREERKVIKQKLKNYKQQTLIGTEVNKALKEMQAAVAISIATTAAINVNSH